MRGGIGLSWPSIVRLGLVQAAIGAIVMLATSLLNRVMVVEYGLSAAIPAGLVAWHYGVQLSRPLWGHRSDRGRRRTPWILGGMVMLAAGVLTAVGGTVLIDSSRSGAMLLLIAGFSLIGAGVGAAGTSLLALLASEVAPVRRSGAAAVTWIMMVAGIAIAAGSAGALLDPFGAARLAAVSGGVVGAAMLLSVLAMVGLEPKSVREAPAHEPSASFADAVRETLADPDARRFTAFIFLSMLAYSMQDLILEPFAGLIFRFTPAQSTSLSGLQHGGVLAGMILAGVGGSAFTGKKPGGLRGWIVAGCLMSSLALAGLASAARIGPPWPLDLNVVLLGFGNGVFAVAAVGAMIGLAGAGGERREGVRMGVWGAAQAIAFGLGGLTGALGLDLARRLIGVDGLAFRLVFSVEALLFLVAATMAVRAARATAPQRLAVA